MQGQDTDRTNMGDGTWIVFCANPQCGKRFESKRSDASYCSSRCRKYIHFAPKRKKTALDDLVYMAKRCDEIAINYPHDQAIFDQLSALRGSIKASLGRIDTQWQQQTFVDFVAEKFEE